MFKRNQPQKVIFINCDMDEYKNILQLWFLIESFFSLNFFLLKPNFGNHLGSI